jgi:DNA-binding winged helix-turn-helix (wHTH) protein
MPHRALTFGRYRLEPRIGLMCGDREVHLTPKALALLSFIADRRGEVIAKEDLFGALWPDVVVGDAALVTCIQEVRKALGDDARRPRYIETVHRRGYRFVAKITPGEKQAVDRRARFRCRTSLPLPCFPSTT